MGQRNIGNIRFRHIRNNHPKVIKRTKKIAQPPMWIINSRTHRTISFASLLTGSFRPIEHPEGSCIHMGIPFLRRASLGTGFSKTAKIRDCNAWIKILDQHFQMCTSASDCDFHRSHLLRARRYPSACCRYTTTPACHHQPDHRPPPTR